MSARIVRSQGEETHQVVIVLKRDLAQAHGKSSTLTMSLCRFGYSLCGQGPDAKDPVQETFWRYDRSHSALRDPLKTRTRLFRTLRCLFLRKVRHAQRRPSHDKEVLDREATGRTLVLARN